MKIMVTGQKNVASTLLCRLRFLHKNWSCKVICVHSKIMPCLYLPSLAMNNEHNEKKKKFTKRNIILKVFYYAGTQTGSLLFGINWQCKQFISSSKPRSGQLCFLCNLSTEYCTEFGHTVSISNKIAEYGAVYDTTQYQI